VAGTLSHLLRRESRQEMLSPGVSDEQGCLSHPSSLRSQNTSSISGVCVYWVCVGGGVSLKTSVSMLTLCL
jgi:hypothetical protein